MLISTAKQTVRRAAVGAAVASLAWAGLIAMAGSASVASISGPASAPVGGTVHITGDDRAPGQVAPFCGGVALISAAFTGDGNQSFGPGEVVAAASPATGAFSVVVKLPLTTWPGTYVVTGPGVRRQPRGDLHPDRHQSA